MSNDVRVILVVLSQIICFIVCGCDYKLPLFVKFIIKTSLIPCVPMVQVNAELAQ